MYAYGFEWFCDNLVTEGKTNIAGWRHIPGSQSMTCMFAGKQPQHSDSHSQLKGDNCNVWKKTGCTSGHGWRLQWTLRTCPICVMRHVLGAYGKNLPFKSSPSARSLWTKASAPCALALLFVLFWLSNNYLFPSNVSCCSYNRTACGHISKLCTSIRYGGCGPHHGCRARYKFSLRDGYGGVHFKRHLGEEEHSSILAVARKADLLRWNGRLLLHPENVLLQSMQTVAALRWEQCRMQCNICRKRDSG